MQPKPVLVSGLNSGSPSSCAIVGFTCLLMNSIIVGLSAISRLKPSGLLGSTGSFGFGILNEPSLTLSPWQVAQLKFAYRLLSNARNISFAFGATTAFMNSFFWSLVIASH